MTIDLYTPTDTKKVRELLQKEQGNLDLITGLPLTKPCLDHKHDSEQFVRGVIDRGINAYVGHIENNFIRHIAWQYDICISDLLRLIADYLERPVDERYRHPMWLKKVRTEFNKLTEKQKESTLNILLCDNTKYNNGKERKDVFNKLLLTREFSKSTISSAINSTKG